MEIYEITVMNLNTQEAQGLPVEVDEAESVKSMYFLETKASFPLYLILYQSPTSPSI